MLEMVAAFTALIAFAAVAAFAFVRPYGALRLSALGAGLAAVGAGIAVQMSAQPMFAAEHGPLSRWFALSCTALLLAAAAGSATALRHALNALGARALRF